MESGSTQRNNRTEPAHSDDYDAPASILARWDALIAEYEAFRDALRACVQQPQWPGVGPYVAMLKTEAAGAARLLLGGPPDGIQARPADAVVRAAASNLAAKEAMWRTIKKCQGVLALDRRFSPAREEDANADDGRRPRRRRRGPRVHGRESGSRTDGVFVNAVVDDGRAWLRVLPTTERQLLIEMAENGWPFGGVEENEEEEEENEDDDNRLDDDLGGISLVRTARDLVRAADANRYQGAYPRVILLLSRIVAGRDAEVDALLQRLQRILRDDAGSSSSSSSSVREDTNTSTDTQLMPLSAVVAGGAGNHRLLTPTLNVDTSILVALASDITHGTPIPPAPWHPRQRVDEMAHERAHPGAVLSMLCGALCGRRLVCTREAAATFRAMVQSMGQASEQARAAVLVDGDGHGHGHDHGNKGNVDDDDVADRRRLATYRALSAYPALLDGLRLPIAVLDEDWDLARIERAVDAGALPSVARPVARDMAGVGASSTAAKTDTKTDTTGVPTLAVFFYGWASGHTTVTTNHTAQTRIARLMERARSASGERGPTVWVCRKTRSLNGTQRESKRADGGPPG
ncbi:hypothetical protein SPI_01380 [Niveomyces insectorum RCEF 264]|uniref:DUF1308 domain-containing protein n=1 Tax=Niveomyces insectorum RCEF 264 TaxID=1081102 RepID=A0A167YX74_9HYPO|nr:hypothetical protein SPI_01380 [Niveomyces insectorum RCEF 264]